MPSDFNDEFSLPPPEQHGSGLPAMSLANLFAILLTFFVVLYAYSNITAKKAESAVKGVKGTFSKRIIDDSKTGLEVSTIGLEPLEQYYADAKKFALEALEIDESRVVQEGQKLIFRLPVDLLFKPDSAEIDDRKLFLNRMADGLAKHPVASQLDVEFIIGREQVPPKGGLPLSLLRAGSFARTMVAMGVPEEKIFTGIADGDPAFFVLTFYPRDETRAGLTFESDAP